MTTKFEDSNTAPKTDWAILNHLLYNKKIPDIPPLFVNGSFISGNGKKKANLFNNFFCFYMHTYKNNNVLPPLFYKPNTRISYFCVTNKDILSIIKLLDSSKLHRYDNIPIKTIKSCKESATIPLKRIVEKSLKTGIFPEI